MSVPAEIEPVVPAWNVLAVPPRRAGSGRRQDTKSPARPRTDPRRDGATQAAHSQGSTRPLTSPA